MDCGLLVGDGPVRRLTVQEAEAYTGRGFLWLHLHGCNDDDLALIKRQHHIPDVAANALFATETRPRCDRIEFGALINLRGPGEIDPCDSDRLVSIRLWAHEHRVTSVSRRTMNATAQVMRLAEAGHILDPGDLVAAYARAISLELDPEVSALGDEVDEIEGAIDELKSIASFRGKITLARREAIAFRRFVAPDRDALLTLANIGFEWLSSDDRLHIREAADKFSRMAEELESIRERAGLLNDQLTELRGEQMNQRSFEISVIAFVFLPLTFLTGLLGMNVEGIPYAREPWAFMGVVAICIAIAALVAIYFLWRHWLGEPK
jgi:zinc transporter